MSVEKNNYIACRVCERVFLSSRALINHLESHIGSEEDAARVRKQIQISHLMSAYQNQTPNNNNAHPYFNSSPQFHQSYFNQNNNRHLHSSSSSSSSVQAPTSNPFNALPNPNSFPNNNIPNPYYSHQQAFSPRALNIGGSGSGSRYEAPRSSALVPFSHHQQAAAAAAAMPPAMDYSCDFTRPFLRLLDYPIPRTITNYCNGYYSEDQLDLSLKL